MNMVGVSVLKNQSLRVAKLFIQPRRCWARIAIGVHVVAGGGFAQNQHIYAARRTMQNILQCLQAESAFAERSLIFGKAF